MGIARLLILVVFGCNKPIPEPLKPHYLFMRCRYEKDCDESVKYFSADFELKFVAGGKDPDGVLTRTYECTRKSSEGSNK